MAGHFLKPIRTISYGITLLIISMVISAYDTGSALHHIVQAALPISPFEQSLIPAQLSAIAEYRVSVLGQVRDQVTGQPVSGVTVKIGTHSTTSGANGRYILTGLAPGQYVLSAALEGYDPALSPILTLNPDQITIQDLELYAVDTTPYPEDPMLTNPLDPEGAPTPSAAERLARLQGLRGDVISIREAKLTGEFLVNYKFDEVIGAAVATLDHEAWELTDRSGRTWWIIKVCGNLAMPLPVGEPIETPNPRPLPPMAVVTADTATVYTCPAEDCTQVGVLESGMRVEIVGCLADGSWCQVRLSDGSNGWCIGRSLRQLAVVEAVPVVETILPTSTPSVGQGKIAFISARDYTDPKISYGLADIYIMNPDGTNERRLNVPFDIPFNLFMYYNLTWVSADTLMAGMGDIYSVNIGNGRVIPWEVPYYLFDFSTDHQKIAYMLRDPWFDIFVANSDGSDSVKVTDTTIRANLFGEDCGTFGFAISPDGKQIVFGGCGGQDIGIANTDESEPSVLVKMENNGNSDHFDWSPDGQAIVFEGNGSGPKPRGVFRVNADGSDLRLLFDAADAGMPVWSPDGRKIAFMYGNQIYVMDADGQNVIQLTNKGFSCCPAWSPK